MMDPFCRGWVNNGKDRGAFSLTLLELERRCWLLKRFFRERGFHTFDGEVYALSEEKVDAEKCREYRDKAQNQIEAAQHSHM